jgi:hypothetical protein
MKYARACCLLVAAVAMLGLMASSAVGVSPHFVGTPECHISGGSVACSFSVAGLGNGNVDIKAETPGGCVNKPGHKPPGHVSNTLSDVAVRAGRVTVKELVVGSVDCPPGLDPVFGPRVTLAVSRGGQVLFEDTIRISGV